MGPLVATRPQDKIRGRLSSITLFGTSDIIYID